MPEETSSITVATPPGASSPALPAAEQAPPAQKSEETAPGGSPPQAGDAAAPASPAERRVKLKIDKAERELAESEVIALAQKQLAGEGRFEEAAKLKKEADDLRKLATKTLEDALSDPFTSLMQAAKGKYGWKDDEARQAVSEYIQKKAVELFQESSLPEEERARRQLSRENEELKKQLKARQEQEEADRLSYEEGIRMKKHLGEITSALTARKIEITDRAVNEVISKMLALSAAGEDPTADDAIELYVQDQTLRTKDDLKRFSPEEILEVYPELAQKVAENTLAKAKAAKSAPPKPRTGTPEPQPQTDGLVFRKAIRASEFR